MPRPILPKITDSDIEADGRSLEELQAAKTELEAKHRNELNELQVRQSVARSMAATQLAAEQRIERETLQRKQKAFEHDIEAKIRHIQRTALSAAKVAAKAAEKQAAGEARVKAFWDRHNARMAARKAGLLPAFNADTEAASAARQAEQQRKWYEEDKLRD